MVQRKIQPEQIDATIVTQAEMEAYVESNSASSPASFKRNQIVSGSVNGVNVNFTTPDLYEPGSLAVYLNGQRLRPGASNDYTEVSGGFTMLYAPVSGDVLTADYLISEASITTTASFVTGETPGGAVNSVNLTYTVAVPYAANSLEVFIDGVRQTKTSDYAENPTAGSFTFVAGSAPTTGSTLRVNYSVSAGHLISGSNSLVAGEAPTGLKNGTNPTFAVLASSYVSNSLEVFLNGVALQRGLDFVETTPTSGTFTMQTGYIPASTDVVTVNYQTSITTTANADTVDSFHAATYAETEGFLMPYYGGWHKLTTTGTYVASNAFDLVGNYAALLQKGTKLRFINNGVVKYNYVTQAVYNSGTNKTQVQVPTLSDYPLHNSAFTEMSFSHDEMPAGFPDWFNTPLAFYAATTNPTLGNSVYSSRMKIRGRSVTYQVTFKWGTSGVAYGSGEWLFSAPVTGKDNVNSTGSAWALDNGTAYWIGTALVRGQGTGEFEVRIYGNNQGSAWHATQPFTWAGNDELAFTIEYEMA